MHCFANDHEIIALANLKPEQSVQELDSYMFQTVGCDVIDIYSEAMELPLYRREILGSSLEISTDYKTNSKDEVEDLFELLSLVKQKHPEVEGVSVGAILSNYQRVRVEHVCSRLNLVSLSYLWRRDQSELIKEMMDEGLNAVLIKVAAMGLKKSHLGKSLNEMHSTLININKLYDVHICGEGGEYETLVLDCPLFKKKVILDEVEEIIHSDDEYAIVAFLKIKKAHLEEKLNFGISAESKKSLKERNLVTVPQISDDEWPSVRSDSTNFNKNDTLKYETSTKNNSQVIDTSSFIKKHPYFYISGLVASTSSDVEKETKEIFKLIKDLLDDNCLTLEDAILVSVYIKDMKLFPILNNQAVVILDQGYFSGQIGLVPCNMKLEYETATTEFTKKKEFESLNSEVVFSLTSLGHCLEALQMSLKGKENLVYCICFITSSAYKDFVYSIWKNYTLDDEIPICFITVSGLPRNCKVEWHVVCSVPKNRSLLLSLAREVNDYETDSEVEEFQNGISSKTISFKGIKYI
ncbi:hypothetical protein HK099_004273 [Clydaea vesicula]|uniref:Diphthine--ammonia ligase n=1 Tax=Clydaea vesicula TaxID=447962 RepID=A0AAD5U8G4_9FUNG|nr:hypothetical protein HK099_004273 [Clydaea vesicula]